MGVPKFFRYISERYPCLSELVRENQVPEFDNLYLDMNGIIHNCSHPNDNDVHFRITEEQIFKDIFYYLETLFNMIKPQKLFFLAVDGVAPRAKMNQQRGRRFRSAKEAEVQEEKARQKGEVLPTEARFDSNCITPGTPFMCRLNNALRYFIQQKISTSKSWRHCKVILSGHETPGEGEHKIMEYIRYLKVQKSYDPNTRHCLYGLDADLIMLGLCTHERHFSLLREEVKFGNKNAKTVTVSQQRFFLLHLSLMREYLEQEFITLKGNMKIPFDIEKVIDDWVLMGFLVGNDFIPNIPNLHINSNALPMLYEAYIKTMSNLDGYINEGGFLNFARLQTYIENLAQFDRDHFTSTYDDLKFLETKHQGAFNERNDDTFGGNQELLNMVKATEFEFDSSPEDDDEFALDADDEKSFEKEFHQHRRDYYVNKMKYDEMTPEVLAEQAECYIRALQWTLSYYYHGVQSWSWYYPHHYAPFISDITNFKNFNINFEMSSPFLPFQQLMSVLPAASKAHVPEAYKKLMTSPDSDLIDFYPTNFETDLNGKKQDWEAVVLIPFIDEKRLLTSLEKHDFELSHDEKARNVHGPMYQYTYASTSQGSLEAPLSFPSIGSVFCEEKQVYRDEVQVPKDKLILGPSKGSLLNVYFAGFPTFKHLAYKSKLKNQNVKVFDQPSRGENMIIVVEQPDELEKSTEDIARELMGKTVHVGWPHLIEAKVVRISDVDKTLISGGGDKTDPQRFRNDQQTIKDHHGSRMGIDVGEIRRVVHVLQATGEEYKFDQAAKIFKLEKTYNRFEIAYPYQCVVQNITAYRKKYQEAVPLFEAFKNGTEVFMLANPNYGAFGKVTDVNCYEKSGRVKVVLTVPQEPDFTSVMKLHDKTQGSYMSPWQASAILSISDNVLNRITGTVLVIAGNKREVSQEGQSKINIGLQLKFPKANEELAGYTKRDRSWLFSEKVIGLVQDYYCKFPVVFEVLGKRSGNNGNDIYFESDFFDTTQGEQNFQALTKWLGNLPHHKAERRQIGTESVEKEVLNEITSSVGKAKELPLKKITMQVKPHLLYAPELSKTTVKPPDASADFQLFDRVVVAKDTEKFSIGMKGTVIGINRIKDLNPVRQECVNKEDIYCEILFDSLVGGAQTGRLAIENLINISFGETLNQDLKATPTEKKRYVEPPKAREQGKPQKHQMNGPSYSKILQNPAKPDGVLLEKKNDFADMWDALKKGGNSSNDQPQPQPNGHQSSNNKLNSLMAKVDLSSDPMPNITAPAKLPQPPVEWLTKLQPKHEPPMSQPPPQQMFFHTGLPAGVGVPQPFHNGAIPSHQPRPPMFFASNGPNFRPILPQPLQMSPQLMSHQMPPQQHQQQLRFFSNNNGNIHFNNNNQNRNRNPSQYQPHHAFVQQPPSQQAQATNPFIPLQASRKATKGKHQPDQPKKSVQQKPILQPKEDIRQQHVENRQQHEEPPTRSHTESIATKPVVDNRKNRLAISFGKSGV